MAVVISEQNQKMMNIKEILKILALHERWLENEEGGERADLSYVDLSFSSILKGVNLINADLRGADLRCSDLRGTNLSGAKLTMVNLEGADLSGADLSYVDLRHSSLRGAKLEGVNLSDANLKRADLSGVELEGANLNDANLNGTDLSGAKNLANSSSIDYLMANFEKTAEGIIVYKTFGRHSDPNPSWVIEEGSIIEENPNPNRTDDYGCGINVATLDWVTKDGERLGDNLPIWKCLIRWEWLVGVVVPYHTDGKIRAERVQLLGIIETP